MSKTKPVIVQVTYKPPDQLRFLEILCNLLNTLKILNEKWYVIRDLVQMRRHLKLKNIWNFAKPLDLNK